MEVDLLIRNDGFLGILWSSGSVRKGVPRNFAKFTRKHLCQSLFCKKEAVAQVLSGEFSEISKNAFFIEYPLTTASYAYVT